MKRLWWLLVVMLLVVPLTMGWPVVAESEVDTSEPVPSAAGDSPVYITFGAVLPSSINVTHNAATAEDLEIKLRDCCIRDDVVEVRINDCLVWTVDSRNGASGSHPWQSANFSVGPGSYNIEYLNVISSVGPSGWWYELISSAWTGDHPVSCFEVEIDIKPRSFPNSINPGGKGVIPVAILTTSQFDATTVNASTVTFGPNAATMVHKKAHLEDADGDGDIDMVLHFRTQATGIAAGDTKAGLFGTTLGGSPIAGYDSVRTVP